MSLNDAALRAGGAFGLPLRESDGLPQGVSSLEERQRNNLTRQEGRVLKEVMKGTGFSEEDVKGPWEYEKKFGGLSVKRLSEAVSESSMPQLLRFGVQNFLFDGYASVPVIYPDLVRVVSSSGAEELYAPLYGAELPQQIAPGQPFGDSRLMGLDDHVPNEKFGRILSVERELVEDDRTGQIVTRAGQMGERMRYVEETTVINAITGATYNSTLGNQQSGGGQLSQANLEAADIALTDMLDPLGNKMLVNPDTLLVSAADKFNAAKLLNSALQPSVPGAAGQNTSGSSGTLTGGTTGWTMTFNPLQGLYNLKVSRFLTSTAGLDDSHGGAYLMEAKKSIVFQDRTALQVMQEAVNSGESFDRDVFRYRTDRRYNAAVIESRYLYQIN